VRELILRLKHARRSIVLCTHDLDEAERLADQVAIMRSGRILALDSPDALRQLASPDTLVRITLASPTPRAPTGMLEFRTTEPRVDNPRAIAELVADGAGIVEVTCTTRSLEDVYAAAVNGDASVFRPPEPRRDRSPAAGAPGWSVAASASDELSRADPAAARRPVATDAGDPLSASDRAPLSASSRDTGTGSPLSTVDPAGRSDLAATSASPLATGAVSPLSAADPVTAAPSLGVGAADAARAVDPAGTSDPGATSASAPASGAGSPVFGTDPATAASSPAAGAADAAGAVDPAGPTPFVADPGTNPDPAVDPATPTSFLTRDNADPTHGATPAAAGVLHSDRGYGSGPGQARRTRALAPRRICGWGPRCGWTCCSRLCCRRTRCGSRRAQGESRPGDAARASGLLSRCRCRQGHGHRVRCSHRGSSWCTDFGRPRQPLEPRLRGRSRSRWCSWQRSRVDAGAQFRGLDFD
jgi:hypothetical protein